MSSGSERYSYDRRRVAMGPASRLKDAVQYIRQGDRQIEQAKGVLHGIVKELELVARHTSDHTLRTNFTHVQQLATELEHLDKSLDKFIGDLDRLAHDFK